MYGLLQDMSDIDIDLSYNIHVKQLIRCCRYFIDLIRQSEFGRIIVISSIWGEIGASMETIYSAMKSAQIGFVKALSQELAMTNVTINAITPGFVSGNMSQVFNSDELKAILEKLPQQRMINLVKLRIRVLIYGILWRKVLLELFKSKRRLVHLSCDN